MCLKEVVSKKASEEFVVQTWGAEGADKTLLLKAWMNISYVLIKHSEGHISATARSLPGFGEHG